MNYRIDDLNEVSFEVILRLCIKDNVEIVIEDGVIKSINAKEK